MECRLICDAPAAGSWNMALDEALLESAGRAGQGSCLRFYGWEVPTLSLGYFQHAADRRTHPASGPCPLVRRATGGGAIVHDVELTYSYTTAVGTHVSADLAALYEAFHATLIEELGRYAVVARLCRAPPKRPRADEPFLCFQRRAERDVLVGDAKIAGSAQRRHRGMLLQHGSVLLQRSAAAPELDGIAELASVAIDPSELAESWSRRVASVLGLTLRPAAATEAEVQTARRFQQTQFATAAWNNRR